MLPFVFVVCVEKKERQKARKGHSLRSCGETKLTTRQCNCNFKYEITSDELVFMTSDTWRQLTAT
jgi:hypothetical protein